MQINHTLVPIYDEYSKVLILGSIPSMIKVANGYLIVNTFIFNIPFFR